jgi:hypothetical protein
MALESFQQAGIGLGGTLLVVNHEITPPVIQRRPRLGYAKKWKNEQNFDRMLVHRVNRQEETSCFKKKQVISKNKLFR